MYNFALMKNTISSYISNLLFIHDCVIIPKFGGFVGNNTSAVLNETTGVISPPAKEILFNPNLQTNDGLLVNHIALSEQITNEEAKRNLEEYVSNIKEKLQSIRTYRIEKVGLLSIGIDGNILFLQDSFTNYNLNSFGLKSQQTDKVDVINKKIELVTAPISNKKGRNRVWRAAAILLPIIGLSLISITQEQKINNIYSQMANFNPFSMSENTEEISELESENMKNISIKGEDVITTPEVEGIEENIIIEKNFHLIAGAFGNKNNAEKLVKKLKAENYNSSIVGTTKGGLIRVSFDSFATKEEANLALGILKSENKSSWILSL
tara:strand:- start:3475 stop:4443 length:969 start_codon:yes stop_codon:yes gene_type:complete